MPEVEEIRVKGYYSRLIERVNYKVLAVLPLAFALLMALVVLTRGVELGIDFKGGTWIEVLTDKDLTPEIQAQIQEGLKAKGLQDVKLYVGWDVESGKNKRTIASTSVVGKDEIASVVSPYVGELLDSDVAKAAYAGKPSADLADRLSAILKQRVDVAEEDGELVITALDLDEASLQSALAYSSGQTLDVRVEKKNLNSRTVGATLGKTFKEQGIKALIAAYVLISIVVFVAYRTIVPSIAVLQAAVCDPLIAFGFMSLLGIPLEPATLAALIMLIGYSVDSDILITSRTLRQRGRSVDESIDSALGTGLMMTGTTIAVMTVMLIVSSTLTQITTLYNISLVLLIGLIADLFTTWFTNAGILKWYLEVPGGRKLFGRK